MRRYAWVMTIRSAVFFLLPLAVMLMAPLTHGLGSSLLISDFSVSVSTNKSHAHLKGWTMKVWQGQPDVRLVRDNGKKVLRLRSHKAAISIYRELKLDLKNYPVLRWRWKVTELPKGADARVSNRDDQAAGVYVVFPRFPSFINSQLIGYVWETSVPVGTILKSSKTSMVQYIVVRSGSRELDKWITEERNVLDDYRKVFGQEPPEVGGISLMIDSDDTGSQAESYFARLEFNNERTAKFRPKTKHPVRYLSPPLTVQP